MLTNIPTVKLGIIAVSRDCFIISLSERRRAAVVSACQARGVDVYECRTPWRTRGTCSAPWTR